MSSGSDLQQFFELLNCESSITNDSAHGEGVHRIGSWYCEDAPTVGYDNVLALGGDVESSFLNSRNRIQVIDAWKLRHLDRHVDLTNIGVP